MTFVSRDKFDLDFSDIHASVFPTDVRDHDRIVARIRERGSGQEFQEAKVWRLSPLGVELVANSAEAVLTRSNKIDLELIIGGQRTSFEGLVVDVVRQNESISLAGVRLSQPKVTTTSDHDQRRSKRWLCGEDFFPTCVSPTPGRFNEYMYFQVRDISRDGLQMICSLRNKYLIPGTQLNLTASFPMVGDLSLTVEITRVGITSERDKDYLVVGTEYTSLSQNARNIVGQYLLQFGNAESLADLRKAGFFPQSVAKGTDFYFLKTEADYEEVLNLRLLAHRAGGTVDEHAKAQDMSDQFDSNSRIVVARYRDKIVASARIHYTALEERLEHEQYIQWPSDYPRRDTVFEITRVCTHPDFRSNDLLAGLLRFIATTCIQPQRPWVLISTTDAMLPFYRKIGLIQTDQHYEHPVYKGNQNVLLSNSLDVVKGKSVHPIYWNALWKDVFTYLSETGVLKPEPMDHARARAYKMLFPIALLVSGISRKPRKSSKRAPTKD
ncbi:MAG: GNAT family N-acyltransferase [Pseudomonadales bacterium]